MVNLLFYKYETESFVVIKESFAVKSKAFSFPFACIQTFILPYQAFSQVLSS